SDVARINRIGRIGRVRNRVADDGAGSEATENAEPDAAATAARRGVARSGHRSKRKHTCGGDSSHRCLHVRTSSGKIASRSLDCTGLSYLHAPDPTGNSDAPKAVPWPCRSDTPARVCAFILTSPAILSEVC